MIEKELQPAMEALDEMKNDSTVPKNVKAKVEKMIDCLTKGEGDISLRINQCLNEFDDISDDANIQPYTRTQIWNVVALMEAAMNR
ncbi:MAG: UPF0147 family protein [Nanoarchaeota archaeon]|nr:UPF0147 family protein [Nanoarchaeota archaeon]